MHRRGFDHTALFYHSEREYVDWLVQFITEGLDQQQPVMLAVPGDRLASLRSALGDAADDVTMADITEFGRNPGRIIAAATRVRRAPSRPACPHHHRTGLGRANRARIPRVHCSTRRWPTSLSPTPTSPVSAPTTRRAWTKACWTTSGSRIRRSGWADRDDTARNTQSRPRSTTATNRWRPARLR